jgi:hypothetical protein
MKRILAFSLFLSLFFLVSLFIPKISNAQQHHCTGSVSENDPCTCAYSNPTSNTCGGFWPNCTGDCDYSPGPPGEVDFDTLEGIAAPNFRGNPLGTIINDAIPYIFAIAGFLLLIYLIVGGFGYMTSGGNPKTMAAAQQKITYAVLGFVIIFLAYWLVLLVGRLLDIPQSRFPFDLGG